MNNLKVYVKENQFVLFEHLPDKPTLALFDNKGFNFTVETKNIYDEIKNEPHLYVAGTANKKGFIYIGKSFQKGGRWKRQHAYHMGTLAHHLHKTTRYDDQNHSHWIDNWMNLTSKKKISESLFSIELKELVYISFIPFKIYSEVNFPELEKKEIRSINTKVEKLLIESYLDDGYILLNVQGNKKVKSRN